MTTIFDGRKESQKIKENLGKRVESLKEQKGKIPALVSILVGENLASRIYLEKKKEFADQIGVDLKILFFLPTEIKKVAETIKNLNCDEEVGGIMIQLPLPQSWSIEDKLMILNLIEPKKDIDCLTAFNLGYLILGKPIYLPATVLAIKKILVLAGINKNNIIGKNVCVVGKSSLVGKPLANLLTNMGATVTVCHRGTENISQFTSQAQILISATGQKGLISGKMVKKGAIVIDVGSPQPDCNFKSVAKKAKFVTPVPGGVGPMTVACLMENFIYCLESFSLKNQGG